MTELDFKNVRAVGGHSQKGQHSYVKMVFDTIGTTNKYYVDIGAYDGVTNSNVYDLKKRDNWHGLMIDNNLHDISLNLHQHSVTRENICPLFAMYGVPTEPDFLCIDIDGMDYWILKEILSQYSPRVILIETNIRFSREESMVLKYNPNYAWDGLNWYGCSPLAVKKLANESGYTPVYLHHDDMFIVRDDLLSDAQRNTPWEEIYLGPDDTLYQGHVKPHHPTPICSPRLEDWEEV